MSEEKYRTISGLVDEIIPQLDTGHNIDEVARTLGISTSLGRQYLWRILKDRADKGKILREGKKYRCSNGKMDEIEWRAADPANFISLKWPKAFDLANWVKIFPKSIIIIAGAPNAGKTALIYNLAVDNMYNPMGVNILSSDMGAEEMRERFDVMDIEIPNPPPFKVYERYDNFADVIDPDGVNLVDYLDLDSEVYMVGAEIRKMWETLKGGVAVIAIQKNIGKELGIGGMFSLKKARVYLSMENGVLKIVKAKSRAFADKNPNGQEFRYKLVGGCKFIPLYNSQEDTDWETL